MHPRPALDSVHRTRIGIQIRLLSVSAMPQCVEYTVITHVFVGSWCTVHTERDDFGKQTRLGPGVWFYWKSASGNIAAGPLSVVCVRVHDLKL